MPSPSCAGGPRVADSLLAFPALERIEVVFAGSGGQGLVLAGILLAEAALCSGRQVLQTQLFNPEMRGGDSRSDVIISTRPIDYLRVYHPEVVVAFTQKAYDQFAPLLASGGLCLADSGGVTDARGREALRLPLVARARERLGKPILANVVALGVLANFLTFITPRHFRSAISRHVSERFLEQDVKAFEDGLVFHDWEEKE